MISDFIYKVLVVVVAIIIANIIIKKFISKPKKIIKPVREKQYFITPIQKNQRKRC